MLDEIAEELGSFAYDPYAFVMWAFPWGEKGTELEKHEGPDEWQTALLYQIRDGLSPQEALRIAVSSGHGVGKSALVAWITWWSYSTYPGTRGVITANTENQLKTKTWVEIAKWHRLFIAKHLFKCTATAIFSVDESQAREWRIDIVPWSEHNTESFAGLHNAGKRIIIIFDEASAIPDVIWETTEGALTDEDTEILWLVCGNPTRESGRFVECFDEGRFAKRWTTFRVDSRSVRRTNKTQLDSWIEDYGLDSDFVRVRILGQFPVTAFSTFISKTAAQAATTRLPVDQSDVPLVLGVDVARFGDDMSVIYFRRGLDGVSIRPRHFQGLDTTGLTKEVCKAFDDMDAAAIFVDETGIGGGVVDQLQSLGYPVFGVTFSAKADQIATEVKYMNKRAEIWGAMRDWLRVGSIPAFVAGRDFVAELSGPLYSFKTDKLQLESKELMKARGISSPDVADALALTFAMPVSLTTPQRSKFLQDYDHLAILEH